MSFSNKASDIQEKHMFIATWPEEDYRPEIWTFQDVRHDFEDFEDQDFISLVIKMKVGESLYEEESNLLLKRIPGWHSLVCKGDVLKEDIFKEI
tara:strand:- start:3741 stop:4022 length:282 start_codon:yes stop_codon:yes gene_type:complete